VTFGVSPWVTLVLAILWGVATIPDSAQFSALVADHAPPEFAGSLMTLQTALGFALTVITVQATPILADFSGWRVVLAVMALGPIFGIWSMRAFQISAK
jgi:MFS family permease